MNDAGRRSKEVMASIRAILLADWDPIGVAAEHPSEYDSYVGGVYRLLANGASDEQIAQHLHQIEVEAMELNSPPVAQLLPIARKLKELKVDL